MQNSFFFPHWESEQEFFAELAKLKPDAGRILFCMSRGRKAESNALMQMSLELSHALSPEHRQLLTNYWQISSTNCILAFLAGPTILHVARTSQARRRSVFNPDGFEMPPTPKTVRVQKTSTKRQSAFNLDGFEMPPTPKTVRAPRTSKETDCICS